MDTRRRHSHHVGTHLLRNLQLHQLRDGHGAGGDDLAAQPDVVHVVVGVLQRQELEELRRQAHGLHVRHVGQVDLQQPAQQLRPARERPQEHMLHNTVSWQHAIDTMAHGGKLGVDVMGDTHGVALRVQRYAPRMVHAAAQPPTLRAYNGMGSSSLRSRGTSGRMCERSTQSMAAAATPTFPPAALPSARCAALPYSSSSSSSVCSTSDTMRRQKKRVSPPSASALTTPHSAGSSVLSTPA